jgi:hypothetical protein
MSKPTETFETPARPGIDIRRQAAGTVILVETDMGLHEITVINPCQATVQVSGSDPRFHRPVLGRFLQSVSALNPAAKINGWIGQAMRMVIAFRNAPFESGVVLAATVQGPGWHYDVF